MTYKDGDRVTIKRTGERVTVIFAYLDNQGCEWFQTDRDPSKGTGLFAPSEIRR